MKYKFSVTLSNGLQKMFVDTEDSDGTDYSPELQSYLDGVAAGRFVGTAVVLTLQVDTLVTVCEQVVRFADGVWEFLQ